MTDLAAHLSYLVNQPRNSYRPAHRANRFRTYRGSRVRWLYAA